MENPKAVIPIIIIALGLGFSAVIQNVIPAILSVILAVYMYRRNY